MPPQSADSIPQSSSLLQNEENGSKRSSQVILFNEPLSNVLSEQNKINYDETGCSAEFWMFVTSIQERIKIMDKLLDESDKWKHNEEEKSGVTSEIREQLASAIEEWDELDQLSSKEASTQTRSQIQAQHKQVDQLYEELQAIQQVPSSGYVRTKKTVSKTNKKSIPCRGSRREITPCEIDRFGNIITSIKTVKTKGSFTTTISTNAKSTSPIKTTKAFSPATSTSSTPSKTNSITKKATSLFRWLAQT